MRHERPNHTLQATALAHEAYLRLAANGWLLRDPREYLGLASLAIREVLVDAARARHALKRGGDVHSPRLSLDVLADERQPTSDRPVFDSIDLLALDEALRELERLSPEQSRLVELRFFGGLSEAEAAAVMEISERKARYEWHYARAWLRRRLESGSAPTEGHV